MCKSVAFLQVFVYNNEGLHKRNAAFLSEGGHMEKPHCVYVKLNNSQFLLGGYIFALDSAHSHLKHGIE